MAYLFRLNLRSLRLSMCLLLTGKNFLFRMTSTRFFNLPAGHNATFSLLEPGGTLSHMFASLFYSAETFTELLSWLPETAREHWKHAARLSTESEWPISVKRHSPVSRFQNFRLWSRLPERPRFMSGDSATHPTCTGYAKKDEIKCQDYRFHRYILLLTVCVWPESDRIHFPVESSHSFNIMIYSKVKRKDEMITIYIRFILAICFYSAFFEIQLLMSI